MKYLMVIRIKEGKFNRQWVVEKESLDEVLKSSEEFPYNWELEKVYEIASEINITNEYEI